MESLKSWEPCLADQHVDLAFFDGIRIATDRITEPRWDRVLPILEEEQVFTCRMMTSVLKERPGARVLDIGSGSGVYAIYAAKLGCRVVAIDISARALRFARENARANKISIVDMEPKPGEIRLINCSYEHVDDFGSYDIVILAPPYNPTCPGIHPALHAEAGELGQRCFIEQLPKAARLLKSDGVCVGNQMLVVNKDGEFEATPELQNSFPGGTFDYIRIIKEDIPVKDFLRGQYATYLNPNLKLTPKPKVVDKYINTFSSERSFSLIYYELKSRHEIDFESYRQHIKFIEHNTSVLQSKRWGDRVSLHRHIVEHTSKANCFPSPALFMEIDALPDFPKVKPRTSKNDYQWDNSVLRYIDSWLGKTGLLDNKTGLFDLILVDTAPWYPTEEGREGLVQESALWAVSSAKHTNILKKLLANYQDNTSKLQRTLIGPFLHPHFTGRNKPKEWRNIQFTVIDIDERFTEVKELVMVEQMLRDIEACEAKSNRSVVVPNSILRPAFVQSDLKDLDVPAAKLNEYEKNILKRISMLKKYRHEIREASIEELHSIDLELCHHVMHRRLDIIAKRVNFKPSGPSALVGIPVSMVMSDANRVKTSLPDNYRGGIWVYAVMRDTWRVEAERYLLDLVRLLVLLYESKYSNMSAKELQRISYSAAKASFTHETRHTIRALKRWTQSPSVFGFTREDNNDSDFAIIPFQSLYRAGLSHLQLWSQSDKKNDLPFYTIDKQLPNDINSLISESYNCAINEFLSRIFAEHAILPANYAELKDFTYALRKAVPKLEITLNPEKFSVKPVWSGDKLKSWIGLTRLFHCEFREALQHSDWKKPLTIMLSEGKGVLDKIIFENAKRHDDFKINIADIKIGQSLNSVAILLAFETDGKNGNGTRVREDNAGAVGANVIILNSSKRYFRVNYIFDRSRYVL